MPSVDSILSQMFDISLEPFSRLILHKRLEIFLVFFDVSNHIPAIFKVVLTISVQLIAQSSFCYSKEERLEEQKKEEENEKDE